ncbi:MAG: Na(+)/H(+) antiporter subunit B [Rhodopila sp.]
MTILIWILLLLTAAAGAGIVFSREPRQQVMAIAANGLVLTLLFTALQAPDVAFSELAVGTVALPLLFLVALTSIRTVRKDSPEQDAS